MDGYQAYRRVQVETASKADLLLLLYDGAIRFAKKARLHLQNDEREAAHTSLLKAQAIVGELTAALDAEIEMAAPLGQLYDFINDRLVQANIDKAVAPIDEVLPLLEDLRDTWREALGKDANAPSTGGDNVRSFESVHG